MILQVTDGFLSSLPEGCWAEGPNRRVWIASLVPDGKRFERDFWHRGKPPLYFQVPGRLSIGEAIEFGCDVIRTAIVASSPGGIQLGEPEREKRRTYAFVQHRTAEGLEIDLAEDAAAAIKGGNLYCRRNGHTIHGVSLGALKDIRAEWSKLTSEQKATFILVTFGGPWSNPDGLACALADWILENNA